jgi:hypothetical protein
MAVIYPNHSKIRHWDGALQATLRRAPVEEFLRTHSLKIANGAARDCDNLVRATTYVIDAGLKVYFQAREEGLAESQQGVVGRLACLTTRAVAGLIGEPECWRIPALLSTAQLLSPWIGLQASACASACFVHQFTVRLQDASDPDDTRVTQAVSVAVRHNDAGSIRAVAEMIALRMSTATAASRPGQLHFATRPPRSHSV